MGTYSYLTPFPSSVLKRPPDPLFQLIVYQRVAGNKENNNNQVYANPSQKKIKRIFISATDPGIDKQKINSTQLIFSS